MQSDPIVFLDNCNDETITSNVLAQIITEGEVITRGSKQDGSLAEQRAHRDHRERGAAIGGPSPGVFWSLIWTQNAKTQNSAASIKTSLT